MVPLPPLLARYVAPPETVAPGFTAHWSGARISLDIDDESPLDLSDQVFEAIELVESIDSANGSFTMVELGAGYGRWLVSAGVLANRMRKDLHLHLIGVEAEIGHFQMMRQHFTDNGIDPDAHTLIRAAVTETDGPVFFIQGHSREWWGQAVLPTQDTGFGDWPRATVTSAPGMSLPTLISGLARVDLIDMDVQGAEAAVIRGARDVLTGKVKRVHIGTHNAAVEAELSEIFTALGWECRNSYACGSTSVTPYGTIEFQDGVQTWVNRELP